MNLNEFDFYATTPRYFKAMAKAYEKKDQDKWVISRQQAYWSILPHVGKKKVRPTDLAKFDWEKESKIINPFGSKEALLEEMRKFKERTEKMEFTPIKGI